MRHYAGSGEAGQGGGHDIPGDARADRDGRKDTGHAWGRVSGIPDSGGTGGEKAMEYASKVGRLGENA